MTRAGKRIGWLVGCFRFNGPLRQYFSLYRAVSQREGEREEKRIDESKIVQTTPTRTYYKRSRPLPYCDPNFRTPRHWKFTQHHRTTRPPPREEEDVWGEGVGLEIKDQGRDVDDISGEGEGVEIGKAGSGGGEDVWFVEKWEGEEWASETVNPWDLLGVDDSRVSFPYLPLDRAEFSNMLMGLLQDLDWHQILEDAKFWVTQRTVSEMAQSTSILAVADSLHGVLVKRFQLNIFEILQGEGPAPPVGNRLLVG